MLIKRDFYLQKLISKRDNGRIKIITGIRRCGKSDLLFKLYKNYLLETGVGEEEIIEIALDEIDNIQYRNPFKLNDYVKGRVKNREKLYYVFIDEIQLSEQLPNPYIENSEQMITFVDTLLGLMKISNLDIYVTGSNSKMLSSDILTQFRDRGDEIHVKPLSFAEVNPLYENSNDALSEYLVFGGMPYIYHLSGEAEKSKYLKSLFVETYLKDIVERNNILNDKEVLDILLDFISSAIGSLTNPYKLSKRFMSERGIKISSSTISRYLTYFEEAFVLYNAKRFDVKGSRYFSTPLKYYFADIGLRNARLNFRQNETTHCMENVIYNDLIRRGYNVDVGVVEQQVRHNNMRQKVQLEIDFVVNKSHSRYYIQSAFTLPSDVKREQELASLKRTGDSFKKIVIQRENIVPYHDDNGILFIGLQRFLLDDDALDL